MHGMPLVPPQFIDFFDFISRPAILRERTRLSDISSNRARPGRQFRRSDQVGGNNNLCAFNRETNEQQMKTPPHLRQPGSIPTAKLHHGMQQYPSESPAKHVVSYFLTLSISNCPKAEVTSLRRCGLTPREVAFGMHIKPTWMIHVANSFSFILIPLA